MNRKLSPSNPFPINAKAHFWEVLNDNGKSQLHLDFGAHDGKAIIDLVRTSVVKKAIGLDANSEVVIRSQPSLPANVELMTITVGEKLPFPDETFSSVSLFGVLEHIYDQDKLLKELNRVMKKGGLFVVAVPGKHFFSFMDMGNWKFVFPRTHRFFVTTWKGKEYYQSRYAANKDGLIGDIEAEKAWHQHFDKKELANLLSKYSFETVAVDGFGFFFRVLRNIRFFSPQFIKKLIDRLVLADQKMFSSAEIWVIARKS
jgi:ubiquinone/menaquinone biosynthesis C-methylase UbiE